MRQIAWNTTKIFIWFTIIVLLVNTLGMWIGGALSVIVCLGRMMMSTFIGQYRVNGMQGVREVKSVLFSKQWYFVFIIYGSDCGPKYGVDGVTRNLKPIDGGDCCCEAHDHAMLDAADKLAKGIISIPQYLHLKNEGDLEFMKCLIKSKNKMNGVYIGVTQILFLNRIITRSLVGKG